MDYNLEFLITLATSRWKLYHHLQFHDTLKFIHSLVDLQLRSPQFLVLCFESLWHNQNLDRLSYFVLLKSIQFFYLGIWVDSTICSHGSWVPGSEIEFKLTVIPMLSPARRHQAVGSVVWLDDG